MTRSVLPIVGVMLSVGTARSQTTWRVNDDSACPGVGDEVDAFWTLQAGINASVKGARVLSGME